MTAQGNHATKKAQYGYLLVAVLAIAGITLFAVVITQSHTDPGTKSQPQAARSTTTNTINFSRPTDHLDQRAIWVQRAENRLAQQQRIEKHITTQQQATGATLSQQQAVIKAQQAQLQSLITQMRQLKNAVEQQKAQQVATMHSGRLVTPVGQDGQPVMPQTVGPHLADVSIALVSKTQPHPHIAKTPDTWVPPGAFVTAVVLQGVAAAAGVTSQSDPRPILLRTISTGTLPHGYHSHLKQCFIVGSGYGDVSSERVYVRLETLSCIRHGVETDFPVYGYVSGTDALTGQRGPVVFRDGPFVARAFLGGVLGGLGNVGQQYAQNVSTSPLGTVTSLNPGRIPLAAAGSGLGTASQMYAQYNIKRAEQYQPIVELNAGNVVNIVFTKGFWLDGHHVQTDPSDIDNHDDAAQPVEHVSSNDAPLAQLARDQRRLSS